MRRIIVSLCVISAFILMVVIGDLWFMNQYAAKMNKGLDAIDAAGTYEEKGECAKDLEALFKEQRFWAHRLIPTNRLEELETLLNKLKAYIKSEDENEVGATVAEIRARVDLLYSTDLWRWYQSGGFRIE